MLDQLRVDAWPARVEVRRHGWRIRWTSGVTRRGNAALAVGAGDRVDELVGEVERFYRDRGAPPLFQVSSASAPPGLSGVLKSRGYVAGTHTLVACAATGAVLARTAPGERTFRTTDRPTDEWFDAYWAVESARARDPGAARVYREVLLRPPGVSRYVVAADGDQVVGVGQLVVAGDWGGVQCMATPPAARRRGAAQSVLHRLAVEAGAAGATRLHLAVTADNPGARALYEGAGFGVAHEYWYYALPA